MQHSGGGARKREWSDAHATASSADTAGLKGSSYHRVGGPGGGGGCPRIDNEGAVIEHEMKRLRLAKDNERGGGAYEGKRWPAGGSYEDTGDDVDMDADMGDGSHVQLLTPRVDYRPINLTLRECHYLRQLRKFQSERVSYLERRAPTDAAAAAVVHAMQGRRR